MKPFDLEAALQGEPFYASGQKCYIVREVTEFLDDKSIRKFIVIFPNNYACIEIWHEDDFVDDIEMWEEPTPTVTLTLPKPFKLKEGDTYFYIRSHETNAYLEVHNSVWDNSRYDQLLYSSGNAFRKEEDAQAWIDAMKNALSE